MARYGLPFPTSTNGAQTLGCAFSPPLAIKAKIERRSASARPISGSDVMALRRSVKHRETGCYDVIPSEPQCNSHLNGMAYIKPPLLHVAFRPRSSLSGLALPTLRSKISA